MWPVPNILRCASQDATTLSNAREAGSGEGRKKMFFFKNIRSKPPHFFLGNGEIFFAKGTPEVLELPYR